MAPRMKPNGAAQHGADPKPNAITKDEFLKLAAEIEALQGDTREASSELGNTMKRAEERGIEKTALKRALADKRLDGAKGTDRRDSYLTYCDWLGVGAQGEMFKKGETGLGLGAEV